MLLIPQLNFDKTLFLDAFSFSSEEINSVAIVLDRIDIKILSLNLNTDRQKRRGLRFIISASEIPKLENTLQIKFEGEGFSTYVIVTPKLSATSYKCQRIDSPPKGCETIYAQDQAEADFLCALVADEKKWLGGVPKPGFCP